MQALGLETNSLPQMGVIKQILHEIEEIISPVFTVAKRDGSGRMILNLKSLNKFIEYKHFKMSSICDARFLIHRLLPRVCGP